MALCSQTLIRAGWPDRTQRRSLDALGLVTKTAVLPHFEKFGHRWMDSARRQLAGVVLLGLDERTAAVWTEDEEWEAAGSGAVTVIKGAKTERFTSGMKVTGLARPARMLPSH
jgi:cyanophycinase-like exopeptidase